MSRKKYATPFEILHAVSLLSQKTRIEKFAQALERIIKPDMTVADIGTGTGILALLAAKAGAKKITAIDVNPQSIDYARRAAKLNGYDSTIDFQIAHFSDFFPQEKYDVVICEMLSSIMLIEQQIPASLHIVDNILKPEGTLLPQSVKLYGVLSESIELWERFESQGIMFPRIPQTVGPSDTKVLSEIEKLCEIDLRTIKEPFSIDENISFEIMQEGIAHGLCGMFEAVLFEDIILNMEDGWRELLIPFDQPVHLSKGSTVEVRLAFIPGELDSVSLYWVKVC